MTDSERDMRPPIPEEVALNVRKVVAQSLDLELDEVRMDASLYGLGAESLDMLDIAFMLESDYQIQFPRTDILQRAHAHFGEEALVVRGVVTDLGLELLAKGMPELDPEVLTPGLRDIDVAKMITVESFVRITARLLEVKEAMSRVCEACGGDLIESESMPEFECASCQTIVPVPSGDDILLADLVQLVEETRDAG